MIPTARTLGAGTIEASFGNLPEPGLLTVARQRSAVLGIGLFDGLEVSGRFAEYATRSDGWGFQGAGISDLSLNLKATWSSSDRPSALHLGAGLLDFGGAAAKFRSRYVAGTQALGPLEWTLGLGQSQALQFGGMEHRRALDGVFGSISYELAPATSRFGRVEAIVEHDSRQPLAGVRWRSPLLPGFSSARLVGSLHRSVAAGSAHPAATVWMVGMSWPLAEQTVRRAQIVETAPPPQRAAALPQAARNSATARLAELKAALQAEGLERVRVGRLADGGWVVAYENHRFGRNEADALGLVLGLAADRSPEELRSLAVLVLKQGLPVLTVRTEPTLWRNFVRSGLPGLARGQTDVQRGRALRDQEVDWLVDEEGPRTLLQLQLRPELAYAVGTEFAMADYSLAARLTATVPLWRGGQLVAVAQEVMTHTEQARPGGAFPALRQTEGLHTLGLQHTFWLGQRVLASGTVGRFEYGAHGAEGSALVYMPGRDDVLRLRGRAVQSTPTLPRGADLAGAISYRWAASPTLWAEAGTQRYTSGSWGPTLVVTRWWEDVALQLYFRKGGPRQYAGLEIVFPLTPRSARPWGPVQVQGPPTLSLGLRSLVGQPVNYVEPRQVRDLRLSRDIETFDLDAGRLSPEYILSQMARMREAFLRYAGRSP